MDLFVVDLFVVDLFVVVELMTMESIEFGEHLLLRWRRHLIF